MAKSKNDFLIFTGNMFRRFGYGGSYDGEKDLGDLNNWSTYSPDSNDILSGSYDILAERSMTLYHTYGPARGAINKPTDYGIGPGLIFRSQPDWRTLGITKESARSIGMEIQKVVDSYQRRFSFYQKQAVLFRSCFAGGDSFLFFERKNGELVDLIETQNTAINNGYSSGDYTLGIKHDGMYRHLGIMKSDGTPVDFKDENGDQNVLQFYYKELGRQLRGYPLAYSVINMARNDDSHWDGITNRAVLESILLGNWESTTTDLNSVLNDAAEANRKKKGKRKSNLLTRIGNAMNIGAGTIITSMNGEKMNWTDLKTLSNSLDSFKTWMINYIGMATGTPPEVITGKYTSSFTAHKGALNDFCKSFTMKRSIFEKNVMDVVVFEIVKDAILQGRLSLPGFFEGGWYIQQAYLSGKYLGPVLGRINPLVEVKAKALEVEQGFSLRSEFAAMNGYEWENFLEEYEREQDEYTRIPPDFKARLLWEEEQNKSNGG